MGVATAVLCVLRFPRAARGAEAAHVDGASPAQPGNSYEYAQRSAIQVSACMWACGHVGMWTCGHVGMWACGHACTRLPFPLTGGVRAGACVIYPSLCVLFCARVHAYMRSFLYS